MNFFNPYFAVTEASGHGMKDVLEFKRILESEAHPCKRFLEKPVDHGHNLRSCKTNPAHLRIPVSRTVRHKQSFVPRGAKLNLI